MHYSPWGREQQAKDIPEPAVNEADHLFDGLKRRGGITETKYDPRSKIWSMKMIRDSDNGEGQ
jgi:hypothetical protein